MNFTARVKNGKIILDDPIAFTLHIQRYENKEIEIQLDRLSKRTHKQNRYYFGVVVKMVCDRLIYLGYQACDLGRIEDNESYSQNLTIEDTHEFLKSNFNRVTLFSEVDGHILGTVGASTKALPTEDFVHYVEHIRQWAAQTLDIEIPDALEDTKYEIKAS